MQFVLAALAGYLLGNIQFAVILSKLMFNDDVRAHGSGNAGATNMVRVFGMKPGIITFLGDFSKGILAVLIGRFIGGQAHTHTCAYIAGLFVVLGHDFPVFLKFRGGKGVASTLAILWMFHPLFAGIITLIGAILLFATRMVSLAAIICMTVYTLLAAVFCWENTLFVIIAAVFLGLILIRHTDNIKRLLRGEEAKLFEKKHTSV